MRILVLAETYPMPNGKVTPMYIHMRNKYYMNKGEDVTVLNFRANSSAVYDGIQVITLKEYKKNYINEKFDVLISHASNIKHHYYFIKKFGKFFPKLMFVFHGHEVLRKSTVYPTLYDWKKQKNKVMVSLRDFYDTYKLRIWKNFFENERVLRKTELVFVSHWMLDEFLKNTGTDYNIIKDHVHIIYNSIGRIFEQNEYCPNSPSYDFVTIRRNIDGEKYCVDVVNSLAKNNPEFKFLVVGKGELFDHIEKSENLEWRDTNLFHEEMLLVLNDSRIALMPTKTDAQGLMMCEMASYGIPVITSDIPVCHEVLDDFENVAFVSNTGNDVLNPIVNDLIRRNNVSKRNRKFFEDNTSGKEWELLRAMCAQQ